MTVIIDRRDPDTDELTAMARVEDGRIVSGQDELSSLLVGDDVPSEAELMDRFRGPTLFARRPVDGDEAEAVGRNPLDKVPVIPDDTQRLTPTLLQRWVAWVRAGKPDVQSGDGDSDSAQAREFNPELHPRGPDGQFVERPWDVPDDLNVESIRATPTVALLDELQAAGEPINAALAQDDIKIDGIPDDVDSVAQAKQMLGGDGLVFQDLEAGDQVDINPPDGPQIMGQVDKTEQVDGGPNLAHVSDASGATYEVPVPDGTTITRTTGPVVPPTDVLDDDPLAPQDVQKGDRISVVTGVEKEAPTHQATGTVDAVSATASQKKVVVNGSGYVLTSNNVQAYDASPQELSFTDVSTGDTAAAFAGNTKVADGVVTDKTTTQDAQYVTIQDAASGDSVQVNADTQTLTESTAVPEGQAADAAQQAQDQGPDISDIEPGDVDTADLSLQQMEQRATEDFQEGDWAYIVPETGGPYAGPVQKSDENSIHVQTDAGLLNWVASDVKQRYIPPEHVEDVASQEDLSFGDADVSDIDPATVSAAAFTDDQVKPTDGFGALQEGDYVTFEGDDGNRHAGVVKQPTPDYLRVRTGHHSDPQKVRLDQNVKRVDPDAVQDVGDVEGVDSPDTQEPAQHTDFELPDIDDIADNPNPPENLDATDLNHPVSPPDDPGHGMLKGQQAGALVDATRATGFGGKDIYNVATTQDTGNRPGDLAMSYPQADGQAVRDQVARFVNEVDGIPGSDANAEIKTLLNEIHEWKGTSYSDEAQAVEKAFHAGLRLPGDLRDDGLDGANPSPQKAAIAAALSKVSQEFISRNFDQFETVERFGTPADDDELPLYRGVASPAVGSLLRDWAEDPSADEITAKSSKMGNYTTDPGLADRWSTKDVVFKQNASTDDMVMSPDVATAGQTGIQDEAEIWLTGGVQEADPSNIQIRSGSSTADGEPITLADLPDDPADMEPKHFDILHQFSKKMREKATTPGNDESKYLLNSQQQVDTMQDVLKWMKQNDVFSEMKTRDVQKFIDESIDFIDQQSPGADQGVPA